MRPPPPASVTTHAGWGWRGFQAGLHGAAAAVALAWALGQWESMIDPPEAGPVGPWVGFLAQGLFPLEAGVLAGMVAIAGLLGAWLGWRRSAQTPHALEWDGARWLLDGEPMPPPQAMVDLGAWMLVRIKDRGRKGPGPAACWLALQQDHAGPGWQGFRAALYSTG